MSQVCQAQAAVPVPRFSPQRVGACGAICGAGLSLTRPTGKYRLYHFFHSTFLQIYFFSFSKGCIIFLLYLGEAELLLPF